MITGMGGNRVSVFASVVRHAGRVTGFHGARVRIYFRR
jgi:hypothetical protein